MVIVGCECYDAWSGIGGRSCEKQGCSDCGSSNEI